MEVRRTVPVKLDVTESDTDLLHETIDQFRDAENHVVRHARDDDGLVITSKRRLHDRTYADVREATDLHANLVQAARSRAAEALKSVVAQWQRGEYTSQRCSHTDCGFTHPGNRPSQEQFECQKCGYEVHADHNAAKNVGFKLLRSLHTSSDGDAPVGVRINAGTLNESGFTTAPALVRSGVHGESPRL